MESVASPGAHVEAQGDVIFFSQDVAKSDAAGGKQVVEIELVDRGSNFADAEEGGGAESLGDFKAIFGLNGEHLFVLVSADGVSAEIAAATELAEGVKGDVAVFELSHAAQGQDLALREGNVSVVGDVIDLVGEIVADGGVVKNGLDVGEISLAGIELAVARVPLGVEAQAGERAVELVIGDLDHLIEVGLDVHVSAEVFGAEVKPRGYLEEGFENPAVDLLVQWDGVAGPAVGSAGAEIGVSDISVQKGRGDTVAILIDKKFASQAGGPGAVLSVVSECADGCEAVGRLCRRGQFGRGEHSDDAPTELGDIFGKWDGDNFVFGLSGLGSREGGGARGRGSGVLRCLRT